MLHATYSGAKQYSTAATEPRVAAVQLLQVKLFAGKWGSATSQIRATPASAQFLPSLLALRNYCSKWQPRLFARPPHPAWTTAFLWP